MDVDLMGKLGFPYAACLECGIKFGFQRRHGRQRDGAVIAATIFFRFGKLLALLNQFLQYADLSLCAYFATVYLARVTGVIAPLGSRAGKAQRIGAFTGGLVWAFGMTGRWRIERALGWWHSRIAGHPDPLLILSPPSFWAYMATGGAVLTVLAMIGREGRRTRSRTGRGQTREFAVGIFLTRMVFTMALCCSP
jgi:hypothetical protein